jgi:DNA sulfur modification protein DndB
LLSGFDEGLQIDKEFKQFRRSYQEIDSYYAYLESIWMRLLEKCPGFDAVLVGKKTPGDLRKRHDEEGHIVLGDDGKPIPGGNAFARPMGQFVVAEVLRAVSINGKSVEDAIDTIMSQIPMDIDEAPWVNVVWNPATQNIQGGKKERKLLVSLISYALGLKGAPKIRELNRAYRDISGNKRATALPQIEWSGSGDAELDTDGNEEGMEES